MCSLVSWTPWCTEGWAACTDTHSIKPLLLWILRKLSCRCLHCCMGVSRVMLSYIRPVSYTLLKHFIELRDNSVEAKWLPNCHRHTIRQLPSATQGLRSPWLCSVPLHQPATCLRQTLEQSCAEPLWLRPVPAQIGDVPVPRLAPVAKSLRHMLISCLLESCVQTECAD